jgi:uncharacterized phage infection (PIP) family protein YhgE
MIFGNDIGGFLKFFVQRYDNKLTDSRLDTLEAGIATLIRNQGVIMANFDEVMAKLAKLDADIDFANGKIVVNEQLTAENSELKTVNQTLAAKNDEFAAEIEALKAKLAEGGMSAEQEAQVVAKIDELEAKLADAPPVPPAVQ